jgi:hypothetical protein
VGRFTLEELISKVLGRLRFGDSERYPAN